MQNQPSDQTAVCQNCGAEYELQFLDPLEDVFERVAPGEVMPAGQCPDRECGAVCHLVKPAKPAKPARTIPPDVATTTRNALEACRMAKETHDRPDLKDALEWLERATQAAPGTSQAPSQVQPGLTECDCENLPYPDCQKCRLFQAVQQLTNSADDQGCADDLTVVSKSAIGTLIAVAADYYKREELTVKAAPSDDSGRTAILDDEWQVYDFAQDSDYMVLISSIAQDRNIAAVLTEDATTPTPQEWQTIRLVRACPKLAMAAFEAERELRLHADTGAALKHLQTALALLAEPATPKPVEMPPKTDLPCGCTHAGIMAGCPVHTASAPSPFNIHPEGNPQL